MREDAGSTPVIGITTDVREEENGRWVQFVDDAYVEAVERSGGSPFIVPVVDRGQSLDAVIDCLEALVITGGRGITQGLVGELPDELPPVDERRYRSDEALLHTACGRSIPVLGICYGLQLINAQFGGTLYGDVERQLQGSGRHSPERNAGCPVSHPLEVVTGSRLQRLMRAREFPEAAADAGGVDAAGSQVAATYQVNSHHFQAVERVGEGLRANANCTDGVIEGLESDDGVIMAVQFHPERMATSVWDCLFDDLRDRVLRARTGSA